MNINSAIRRYLHENKITQTSVAEKCGWSRERVSCIVKGKQRVSAEDMRQICNALSLPYDFFYNATNDRR